MMFSPTADYDRSTVSGMPGSLYELAFKQGRPFQTKISHRPPVTLRGGCN